VRYVVAALLVVLVAVLAGSAMPAVRPLGVQPDLALLLAVCWAVVWGPGEGLLIAVAVGMLADLLSVRPVGLSVLGMLPAVLMASLSETGVVRAALPVAIAAVGAGTLAQHALFFVVSAAMGDPLSPLDVSLRSALPSALINMLWTPLAYVVLRGLRAVLGPRALGPRLGG
jgi:rod shape-determining protein MreD